jgi:hypothetical protein
MENAASFDQLFQQAVTAIDHGDINTLQQLLVDHPELVRERLHSPGAWLREQIGQALDGFFKNPYLLWFVTEDVVRNDTLPTNIVEVTNTIIQAMKQHQVDSMQEQLDFTLLLTAWSGVAHRCNVQIPLMDALIDAGASVKPVPNNALVNGHFAAAEHAVQRGAPLTLASALCLDRWDEASQLVQTATPEQKQFAFVLCALNGRAKALSWLLPHGVDINKPCPDLYSHGTPLHHAVWSGSLDAVKVLVEAGASLDTKDTAWNGTPLGWAEYGERKEIADYLRSLPTSL